MQESKIKILWLIALLPMAPFLIYYSWYFASSLGDYVAMLLFEGEGRKVSLAISPPNHYLWYASSKWLACVAIPFFAAAMFLTQKRKIDQGLEYDRRDTQNNK